jgi:outer membrane receptor protein involved in Fe transport
LVTLRFISLRFYKLPSAIRYKTECLFYITIERRIYSFKRIFIFLSHDLIQFELASGIARADNLGQAVVRGGEVVVAVGFARFFRLTNNYTYQRAFDQAVNRGRRLVGRPEHELHSELACGWGPAQAALRLAFIDNQYLDALNTQKVNNRLELAANASWLIKRRYRLGLEVRNLTDAQIVDAIGFPLPGLGLFGRLDVAWD